MFIIMGGSNNVEEVLNRGNTREIINPLLNFKEMQHRTLVTTILSRFDLAANANSTINTINKEIKTTFQPDALIDIHEACQSRENFTQHGLHLNQKGKDKVCTLVSNQIKRIDGLWKKKEVPVAEFFTLENDAAETLLDDSALPEDVMVTSLEDTTPRTTFKESAPTTFDDDAETFLDDSPALRKVVVTSPEDTAFTPTPVKATEEVHKEQASSITTRSQNGILKPSKKVNL